jgi:hypothetical protein
MFQLIVFKPEFLTKEDLLHLIVATGCLNNDSLNIFLGLGVFECFGAIIEYDESIAIVKTTEGVTCKVGAFKHSSYIERYNKAIKLKLSCKYQEWFMSGHSAIPLPAQVRSYLKMRHLKFWFIDRNVNDELVPISNTNRITGVFEKCYTYIFEVDNG